MNGRMTERWMGTGARLAIVAGLAMVPALSSRAVALAEAPGDAHYSLADLPVRDQRTADEEARRDGED